MATYSGERGAISLGAAALLLPAILVGGVGGYALQHTLSGGDSSTSGSVHGEAAVYPCPGAGVVNQVHDGDRVFVIGVNDQDGDWLLIRNPEQTSEHWWIQQRYVRPDSSVADLPKVGCDDTVTEAAGPLGATATPKPSAKPSITPTDSASTTTTPTASATAGATTSASQEPGGSTSTHTSHPAPHPTKSTHTPKPSHHPTTAAPTTTPTPAPNVTGLSASDTNIWERWNDSSHYSCGKPSTSSISATATNTTSATMSWRGAASGSTSMTRQGDTWGAVLGPFDQTTVSSNKSLTVTVTAKGPGGTDHRSTSVTLHDCYFG